MNMQPVADIALLLEGTYPYVRGGVSEWVHQLITGLPDLTFAVIFLGGKRPQYGKKQYAIPSNVTHEESHYLFEVSSMPPAKAFRGRDSRFRSLAQLHEHFRNPQTTPLDPGARKILRSLGRPSGVSLKDFLYAERAWELICDTNRRFCTDPYFQDFYWIVRGIHLPLFTVASITQRVASLRVLHAISTGYAGFLGVLLHEQQGLPLIITEHGIYTKERSLDIAQAQWIREVEAFLGSERPEEFSYCRNLLIRYFHSLGRLAYEAAEAITTLLEGNRQRQVAGGANPARTRVIPNGINVTAYAPLREHRPKTIPPILGLIGRVVGIKDIKTFIRTMRTVCAHLPDAEGWIIGPDDEDADYARECHELVDVLALQTRVKFLGVQKVGEILPQLGLVVLTSVSEGQPLVVLESFAAGLPVLATDVGGCRELIEGASPEDRALGTAGVIVPIADPEAVAREAIGLLTNPQRWHAAQAAAIRRVERYYTLDRMLETYRELYQQVLKGR